MLAASRLLAIALSVSLLVGAEQARLAPEEQRTKDPVDFETLFGTASFVPSNTRWTDDTWNLLSFGYADPRRCFGSDKDVKFDVAVIGVILCLL